MISQAPTSSSSETPHRRRPRYKGKNPRSFELKYKELSGDPETLAKVCASGKTPAGTHRPIMVNEIISILAPHAGDIALDCTMGFGGHSTELAKNILPEGILIGLDTDPIEQPRTTERLSQLPNIHLNKNFFTRLTNYAGAIKVKNELFPHGADIILADLGLSSMQIDDPKRGFSYKINGPLDMRMNPKKGISAHDWLLKTTPDKLEKILRENADEPYAHELAQGLANKDFSTTAELREKIKTLVTKERIETTIPRVFQAIRIAVNDEFSALNALLKTIPLLLKSGGRVAILTFHSGEDRRVKHAFKEGLEQGIWSSICQDVLRPTSQEMRDNPRSTCAKLRWAIKK